MAFLFLLKILETKLIRERKTHLIRRRTDLKKDGIFFYKIFLGTLTYNLEYYNIFTKVTTLNIFQEVYL
ncbi:hypothetical protein BPUM_1165 [Bacillus pumilus SAFR-032]|uniref:Uncharacterized protein n=1 Tax=Bacillus pumilus (strain SAFR-032) TaxID=315750 RepID=A8FC82_BACP2|nr:hypothetical protein BPUM_1165 [Bacillus pumilus SAFR-032]